jgi:hypothetical protein
LGTSGNVGQHAGMQRRKVDGSASTGLDVLHMFPGATRNERVKSLIQYQGIDNSTMLGDTISPFTLIVSWVEVETYQLVNGD